MELSQTDVVCRFCTEIDLEGLRVSHTTISALLASAKKGCPGCKFFLDVYQRDLDDICSNNEITPPFQAAEHLSSHAKLFPEEEISIKRMKKNEVMMDFPTIVVQDQYYLPSWLEFGLSSTLDSHPIRIDGEIETNNRQGEELVRPISSHSGDDACLDLAKSWLEQCTHQHGGLCASLADSPLPTRLIYIPRAVSESLRLCNTEESKGSYVALSYCWGQGNTFQTTRSTLKERLAGFNIELLPRTLRDAVYIARFMGFEWIWIDALCIIQGDAEDWGRHSALMGAVYGNAAFTISANNAADAGHGIFGPRKILSCSIFGERHDRCLWTTGRSFNTIMSLPLHTRGWAFQERMLSPRTLHILGDQIAWECSTDIYREGLHKSVPYWERDSKRHQYADMLKDITKSYNNSPSGLNKRIRMWNNIVEELSNRNFTFESDRLSSISSIASSLEVPELGHYLAGVWEHDPFMSMCWIPSTNSSWNQTHATPSWSWAWVSDRLDMPLSPNSRGSPDFTDSIDWNAEFGPILLDFHVTPRGPDPKGQVMDGSYLVIDGSCQTIRVKELYDPSRSYGGPDTTLIYIDGNKMVDEDKDLVVCFDGDPGNDSELNDKDAWSTYLCVQMKRESECDSWVYALVLRRIDGMEEAYTRAGLCEFKSYIHDSGWERKVLKLY